ncbi:SCP2 sterol-binding domain-containing protein [Endozoicomonas sp. SM1973]|uniref:SCP2 sterol-binding domain-containing protein n=1 Tax=Spartinivicinus marinus TaxID=2994442 RepID=A0A853I5Y2_9GAMM|nr:SCP2 sterol-binding domain-containing protein [Spartinivicinus marinus]MCX4024792.1 SCP2 sterol-binding domain-containing protein [Spartinivicinus marinus]NYZ68743.1 SCP2 sterol-binding domain-containing protein [Spartinivicinus marinus]
MSNVTETLNQMKSKFNADAAAGMDVVFQLQIENNTYHIIVKDGNCDMVEGSHDDPSVTLTMDGDTFTGVMDGSVDGMQAFMAGQLRAEGDVMLATRLSELFPLG